jgi:low temperature requirement protein LtrA
VEFSIAYAVLRAAHVALFTLASGDDPLLRRSVSALAVSSTLGFALLLAGALAGDAMQAVLWAAALAIDMGGPYFFRSEGWKLAPEHFAERHGLVVIIALGESIVALGVGADLGLTLGVATTAVFGVVLAFELWWIYFDIVAIANVRRLVRAPVGREQNELARDVYSYLHFPLVAAIVLVAFGLHEALAHSSDPLKTVPAFALLGGVAAYLLGHVAIRLRGAHSLNRQRLLLAIVMLALIPVATEVAALVALVGVTVLLAALIAYETRNYGEIRGRYRHDFAVSGPSAD